MTIGEGELGRGISPAPLGDRGRHGVLRPVLGRIANLLLPPVGISCRARISSHGLICGDCFAKLDFIAPPLCARLGIPLPYDAGEPALSAAAIASPPVYDRARAAARYSDTCGDLYQSFKYRDRQEGLMLFARWLQRAGAELLTDSDLIVPVPLYPSRLWWRRFNQSAMLASALGRLTGLPVDCFVLKRVRRTSSQVGLSADQRRRNVAGCLQGRPGTRALSQGTEGRASGRRHHHRHHGRGKCPGLASGEGRQGRRAGAGAGSRAHRLRALVLVCSSFSSLDLRSLILAENPFCGPKLKVERAKAHIADLEKLLNDYSNRVKYGFVEVKDDYNDQFICLQLRFSERPPAEIPLDLSRLVSEIIKAFAGRLGMGDTNPPDTPG